MSGLKYPGVPGGELPETGILCAVRSYKKVLQENTTEKQQKLQRKNSVRGITIKAAAKNTAYGKNSRKYNRITTYGKQQQKNNVQKNSR